MRITNGMMVNNMMSNLNSNLNRLSKYNDQGSSGRKFSKPSDDPIAMSKSLKLYTDVSKIEQYERNLRDANSWMRTTEDALSEIGEIIQRAREVSVGAANGTNTENDTKGISEEIKQLKDQLVKLGNTKHAGRSIFTGHKTDQDLFKIDADGKVWYDVSVDPKDISVYNIGVAENIEINIIGSKVFGVKCPGKADPAYGIETHKNTDSPTLIDNFEALITAMGGGDVSGSKSDIDKSIGALDKAFDQVLAVRAEVGAKTNRLEMTEKRLSSEKMNFTELLSMNEDVDFAELIMQTKVAENIYNASLAIGSKIIQPSLMDFLR